MKTIGIINGERVRLHIPERRSVEGPVPTATLFFGERRVALDEHSLPERVRRTIPVPIVKATLEDWEPFLVQVHLHQLWR